MVAFSSFGKYIHSSILKQGFLNFFLFSIGLFSLVEAVYEKRWLRALVNLELLLLLIGTNLLFFSRYYNDTYGYLYTFVILTVAAAETAIGLAVVLTYLRFIDYKGEQERESLAQKFFDLKYLDEVDNIESTSFLSLDTSLTVTESDTIIRR